MQYLRVKIGAIRPYQRMHFGIDSYPGEQILIKERTIHGSGKYGQEINRT